ncbi:MAG: metal-dependent transcriptional regulator [Anaerolineae bacterium]
MYLLHIALLQETEQPVPVPRLAQELAVSPVSANEMCRKLAEKQLITYEPYKGVLLTGPGAALAERVLRHRRLWEVFFVQKLGIDPAQAEEMACRFEHVTPDALANQLDSFLGHPTHSPQNQPIPQCGQPGAPAAQPLAGLVAGDWGQIVALNADDATRQFLQHLGLTQGSTVQVLAAADESLLLATAGQPLSLTKEIAAGVAVTVCQ